MTDRKDDTTPPPVRIMMVAGEPSGDKHGAHLIEALRESVPDLTVWGMGGERMARQGAEILAPMEAITVMGFVEALAKIPAALSARRTLLKEADRRKPDLAVLIDSPGFNLGLAEKLKKRAVPVLYFICPQVWAWRKGRLKKMSRILDRVAAILPFEEKMLRDAGIEARYVGHPLVEQTDFGLTAEQAGCDLGLDGNGRVLGLLPGSRPGEVFRILPVMLQAVKLLLDEIGPFTPVLALSEMVTEEDAQKMIRSEGVPVEIVENKAQSVIKASRVAVAASGTVALEAALLDTPLIVVYKMSWTSYRIARMLIQVPYISLVNLLADRKVVPEIIQGELTPERIAEEVRAVWDDGEGRRAVSDGLAEVRRSLGTADAGRNTADMVLELIGHRNPEPEKGSR